MHKGGDFANILWKEWPAMSITAGSFPKPLTAQEEQHYLKLAAEGDLQARNILIERNLRLVAHIMKNG